jgi:hypothetical protein
MAFDLTGTALSTIISNDINKYVSSSLTSQKYWQIICSDLLYYITNCFPSTYPSDTLNVSGTITASYFSGDGSQLINVNNGTILGNWVSYPLTIGAVTTAPTLGTVSCNIARWRRIASDIEIQYDLIQTVGSAGSGVYLFPLPPQYTIDSTKYPIVAASAYPVGTVKYFSSGSSGIYTGAVSIAPSVGGYNNLVIEINTPTSISAGTSITNTLQQLSSSSTYNMSNLTEIHFTARFPISGWGSNIGLINDFQEFASNNGSGGTSAGAVYTTGSVYGPQGSAIVAVNSSTTSGFSSTSYVVTFNQSVTVTDFIIIELFTGAGGTWKDARYGNPFEIQNAAAYGIRWDYYPTDTSGKSIVVLFGNGGPLASGSTYGTQAASAWSTMAGTSWRARKISNGNFAQAQTSIAAECNCASANNIGNSVQTFIDFPTLVADTNNTILGRGNGNNTTYTSTWRYIVPVAGRYHVTANISLNSAALLSVFYIAIAKNGTEILRGNRIVTTAAAYVYISVAGTINCVAGDAISIDAYQASGNTQPMEAMASANHVEIYRLGV